jgi:hypothetical protein
MKMIASPIFMRPIRTGPHGIGCFSLLSDAISDNADLNQARRIHLDVLAALPPYNTLLLLSLSLLDAKETQVAFAKLESFGYY